MMNNTINLSEYILLPREERIAHIDLGTPCECYKEDGWQENEKLFGKLCELQGVADDVDNRKHARIDVCHLCPERHCHNPNHAYIGTRAENRMDVPKEQRSEAIRKGHASRTPEQRKGVGRKIAAKTGKAVEVTNMSTNETMTFDSIGQAARAVGVCNSYMSMVLHGHRRQTGGHAARFVPTASGEGQ